MPPTFFFRDDQGLISTNAAFFHKETVKIPQQLDKGVDDCRSDVLQPKRKRNIPTIVALKSNRRINGLLDDLSGIRSDLLDLCRLQCG